jgi:hydrogenase/urease accessory protein HupE
VGARFGDFYAGALHPLTAFEHLLPIIALCLLAGFQPPRDARWILAALPLGLLTGTLLHFITGDQAWTPVVNLIAFSLLGIAVACAPRVPRLALLAVATVLGITIGLENGLGLPPQVAPVPFALGVASAGFAFAALGSALAVSLQRGWPVIAKRVAGSWIAAVGIMLTGLHFATG